MRVTKKQNKQKAISFKSTPIKEGEDRYPGVFQITISSSSSSSLSLSLFFSNLLLFLDLTLRRFLSYFVCENELGWVGNEGFKLNWNLKRR